MEIKIKWNEDEEFDGLEGSKEDIPCYAQGRSSTAAIISGRNDFRFEEPIWLPTKSAYELHEAGVIEMDDSETTELDGVTVYIYRTA